MAQVQPIAPLRIAGGDVHYAQGMRAGPWVFLTGHLATDFASGMAPEVAGPPHFPLLGTPKHRREGDFILDRFARLLAEAGTDLTHALRLDQYYPTWKAVNPYHHARRAAFGDYIPPSTSIIMPELLVRGADIEASLLAVLPGDGREVRPIHPSGVSSPASSGYVPAARCGDYVFVAGQMASEGSGPIDPRARVPAHSRWAGTEIRLQAEYIIQERLRPTLEAAGSSLAGIVKAQAYLQNVDDFPHFVDVWNGLVGPNSCALTLVPSVAYGNVDAILEINVLALADDGATRKQVIEVDRPAPAVYGAPAVRTGDLLLLSGLMAVDDDGLAPGVAAAERMPYFGLGPGRQMRLMLDHAERICRAAGASLDNLVRVHQFHTDLNEFYPAHRAWQEVLPDRPIPYSAIGVPGPLPAPGCTILLDLWVYAPD